MNVVPLQNNIEEKKQKNASFFIKSLKTIYKGNPIFILVIQGKAHEELKQ